MTIMYLASEWLVNVEQLSQLRQLSDLAISLGGKFLILPAVHPTTPPVDKLLIQVSEIHHDSFLQQAEELGFTAWQQIEPAVFDDELAFNPYRKSAFTQRTWEARVRIIQQQTQPRPKKQEVALNPVKASQAAPQETTPLPGSRRLNGDSLMKIRNFGDKSLDELVSKLKEKGYLQPDDVIRPPRKN
jgi:hypothetical protein